MNHFLIVSIGVAILLTGLTAGCTDISSPPQYEPTVVPLPPPTEPMYEPTPELPITPVLTIETTPIPVSDPYTGPVTFPQKDLIISVNVVKDPIYKVITATFTGGLGQKLVKTIEVRVTTPDGEVSKNSLDNRGGDEIMVQGTGGNDRVQVVVWYMNGEVYKIYDETLSGSRIGEITPVVPVTPLQREPSDQTWSFNTSFEDPVILPPDNLSVIIDVAKDPIYNVITATFLGGHGQGIVSNTYIHASLSDGQEVTEKLGNRIGAITEIQGTKGLDRVEVIVLFKSGESYKIYDETLSGRR